MKGLVFTLKSGKSVAVKGDEYSESKFLAEAKNIEGLELVIYRVDKPVQGDDEDDEDFAVRLEKYNNNAKFTATLSGDGMAYNCLFSRKFVNRKFGKNSDKTFEEFCESFANPFGFKGTPKTAPIPKGCSLFVGSAEDKNGVFPARKDGRRIAYRFTLGQEGELKLEEDEVAGPKLEELAKIASETAESKPEQNSEPEEW